MSATRRFEWLAEALLRDHEASALGDPVEAVSWHREGIELVLADCGDDTHVSLVGFLGVPDVETVTQDHLARDLLHHAYRNLANPRSVSFALDAETGELVSRMVIPYSAFSTPQGAADSLNEWAETMLDEVSAVFAESLMEAAAMGGEERGIGPSAFA
jgi:hypothetical protein